MLARVQRPLLAPLALSLLSGCAQLVAFGEPVIGQPDVVEQEARSGGPLCDPDVAVGERAGCDESCVLEADGRAECARVERSEGGASADVSEMREVAITMVACAEAERPLRITGESGASIAVEEGALVVRPARGSAASPVRRTDFLASDEECAERTIVVQTGRMELAEGGIRLCSPELLAVEGRWELELAAPGLRSLELCFRR